MKLSRNDEMILNHLKNKRQGDYNLKIALALGKDPAQIIRRLQKMTNHGILEKMNSKPVFYKIKLQNRKNLAFFIVECPKCKWEYKIHIDQTTKRCENPECKTKKGSQTRFYITKDRIIKIDNMI